MDFLGTVATADGRTPLLVRANEEDRKRVSREVSGDVLFTDAQDMRDLEDLLNEHEVLFAVLERPAPAADEAHVADDLHLDWRDYARRQLAYNRDIAGREYVMDEDFVFLAALPAEAFERALVTATRMLDDQETQEEDWQRFLEVEAVAAEKAFGHVPLLDADEQTDLGVDEQVAAPVLKVGDLSVAFKRGALGGPRSLADSATT